MNRPDPDLHAALQFYRDILEREGEAPPLLRIGFDDEGATTLPLDLTDYPVDSLVAAGRAVAAGQLPRPDWAMFCSDAYTMRPTGDKAERLAKASGLQRGELARRFKAGDPEVVEGVVAIWADGSGDVRGVTQPYRRFPALGPRAFGWEDLQSNDDGVLTGSVVDGLALLLGFTPPEPPPGARLEK